MIRPFSQVLARFSDDFKGIIGCENPTQILSTDWVFARSRPVRMESGRLACIAAIVKHAVSTVGGFGWEGNAP